LISGYITSRHVNHAFIRFRLISWRVSPRFGSFYDETDTEIQAWLQKIKDLKGWTHLRAAEGVRSKVAGDYSILGIPVMILLNAKTKEIISLPESAEQLISLLKF